MFVLKEIFTVRIFNFAIFSIRICILYRRKFILFLIPISIQIKKPLFCESLEIKVNRRTQLHILQIVLGILFLLQPLILPVRPYESEHPFFTQEVTKNIVANVLILVFFYFNYFFLIPKYFFNRKYFQYFSIVVLCFAIILTSAQLVAKSIRPQGFQPNPTAPMPPPSKINPPSPFPQAPPSDGQPPSFNRDSLIQEFRFFFTENDQTFFLFGCIVLFSLLIKVSGRYYKTENAKQEAEINFLLAQINPHFLFNALNSIYTLTIKENAQQSSNGLLKLSGLLRYVFTETHNNIVPLEKELTCIKDFIDLQKLRITDKVHLTYIQNGDAVQKQIAPMLLMPFVENAFKHGISTEENTSIDIEIDILPSYIYLKTSNTKVSISNENIGKSGVGIVNTKTRLQLLYPDLHQLEIKDTETLFTVHLKIYFA